MKKLLILIFFTFSVSVYSQNLKTYNGKFKNGNANYEYYELESKQEIYNGKFNYSIDKKHFEKGTFNNNSKIGFWQYYHKNEYVKIEISGNYKNNLKTGKWLFSLTENDLKKEYFINFINDTIIGEIEFNGLKGKFDEKGKFIDDWKIEDDKTIYKAKFSDNILTNLEYKTKNGTLLAIYNPDLYKFDFQAILDKNNSIVKKEYNLDWNFRMMSGEFDVDKIYGINQVKFDGLDTEYLEKELFFNNFFDEIINKFNSETYDNIGWEFLQRIELKVNPNFLYLNSQKTIPNKIISEKNSADNGLDIFFDNKSVDEKPIFINGNDKFIKYITENYSGFDEVSGRVIIEFIIDKNGKLNILTIRTTGSISENEIRRILNNSPQWKPGKKEGKNIEVKYIIPINIVKK
jgi:protein TonB